MKKWLLIPVALLIILIALYFIVPSTQHLSETTPLDVPEKQVNRFLTNRENWKSLSDSSYPSANDSVIKVGQSRVKLIGDAYGKYALEISDESTISPGLLQVLPRNDSSAWVSIQASSSTGTNPLTRISNYFLERKKGKDIRSLLQTLARILENREKDISEKIIHTIVIDTSFISLQFVTNDYPSTTEIYTRIDSLRKFAESIGAPMQGHPMLNVRPGTGNYYNMVAIPVAGKISSSGPFQYKRMVKGNILVHEFTGGEASTRKAFDMVSEYVSDRNIESPAIPYISLITDRRTEPDTSKWISKIYFPVY